MRSREDAVAAGTRETAIIYAMTSAAVVHAITRSCSRGELQRCACDPSKVRLYIRLSGRFVNSKSANANFRYLCLQRTVGWAAETASGRKKTERRGASVVIYLE